MEQEKIMNNTLRKSGEKKYHKVLGFPKQVNSLLKKAQDSNFVMKFTYTSHARQQAYRNNERIRLPDRLPYKRCDVFEAVTINETLNKVVFRTSYTRQLDLIMVVSAEDNTVLTVWLNKVSDTHKSLDTTRYCIPS